MCNEYFSNANSPGYTELFTRMDLRTIRPIRVCLSFATFATECYCPSAVLGDFVAVPEASRLRSRLDTTQPSPSCCSSTCSSMRRASAGLQYRRDAKERQNAEPLHSPSQDSD